MTEKKACGLGGEERWCPTTRGLPHPRGRRIGAPPGSWAPSPPAIGVPVLPTQLLSESRSGDGFCWTCRCFSHRCPDGVRGRPGAAPRRPPRPHTQTKTDTAGARCGRMPVGSGLSPQGGHRWTGRARGGLGAAPAPPWALRALGGGSVVQGALCGAQVLRVCSPKGPGVLAGGGGLASFMGRTHAQHARASVGCGSHVASPLGWPAASTAPGLPGPLPCGSAPSVSGGGVYPLGALSLGGLRGARQSISSPRPTRKGFHRQEHGLALPLQKTAPVQAPEPAGGCQPLSAGRGRRGGRCL